MLENPFPLAGMMNFVKNTFPLEVKKLSLPRVSVKWRKQLLPLARILVSPSRNKLSLCRNVFRKLDSD